MKQILLATLVALVGATAAQADQVITDKMQKSYAACVVANGIVLAELKAKGLEGDVIVHAPASKAYIAKVAVNGNSALLMCEGAHQTVVIPE